ncbi:MAG TPA: Hsp70 family protein, partial [Thermoplasmata archaeon]|nr:Hsp70 family protein [Thermoplasmata archaeon]
TTSAENQGSVEIKVAQGERPMWGDNVALGSFMLTGIPPAARGTPQIEVSFDIDANGILSVSAKDLATNRKQGITITASNKLSKEDVNRMVSEAEKFAEQDRKRAGEVESRNRAESLGYEAERVLVDAKDRISEAEASDIKAKIAELREALGKNDPAAVASKSEELTRSLHALAQKLYRSETPPVGESPPSGGTSTAEESAPAGRAPGQAPPVDADFKVVDEKGDESGAERP